MKKSNEIDGDNSNCVINSDDMLAPWLSPSRKEVTFPVLQNSFLKGVIPQDPTMYFPDSGKSCSFEARFGQVVYSNALHPMLCPDWFGESC